MGKRLQRCTTTGLDNFIDHRTKIVCSPDGFSEMRSANLAEPHASTPARMKWYNIPPGRRVKTHHALHFDKCNILESNCTSAQTQNHRKKSITCNSVCMADISNAVTVAWIMNNLIHFSLFGKKVWYQKNPSNLLFLSLICKNDHKLELDWNINIRFSFNIAQLQCNLWGTEMANFLIYLHMMHVLLSELYIWGRILIINVVILLKQYQ